MPSRADSSRQAKSYASTETATQKQYLIGTLNPRRLRPLILAGVSWRSDFQETSALARAPSLTFRQSHFAPEDHTSCGVPQIGGHQYRNLRHSGSTYLAQRWTTVLGPDRYHPT